MEARECMWPLNRLAPFIPFVRRVCELVHLIWLRNASDWPGEVTNRDLTELAARRMVKTIAPERCCEWWRCPGSQEHAPSGNLVDSRTVTEMGSDMIVYRSVSTAYAYTMRKNGKDGLKTMPAGFEPAPSERNRCLVPSAPGLRTQSRSSQSSNLSP